MLLAALAMAAALGAADPDRDAPSLENVAVTARYTPGYHACLERPEGESTAGMIDCLVEELAIQDTRLNAEYRKSLAALNPRQRAKLQAAERAWMAFRDAECRSYQDEDWGTLSRITANTCMLDMTVERLMALENYPPE